jgi:hypothetical protein
MAVKAICGVGDVVGVLTAVVGVRVGVTLGCSGEAVGGKVPVGMITGV